MTTPISGLVADYVGKAAGTQAAAKKDAKPGGDLDKDAFLKLLVAQLKYQDPGNPMEGSAFIAETAQFTAVEKLTELATAQQDLVAAQLRLGASNLVGRTVGYLDTDGHLVTGVVASASFNGSAPTLRVGDTDVALSDVKEVRKT
jgi:flagellar basal-body rod modification protein FlgD